MHSRLRKSALAVLTLLQLEACIKRHLPPEDYWITETVTQMRNEPDSGVEAELAKK
jgi:hypothetical protein